jgi:hypothetical protein
VVFSVTPGKFYDSNNTTASFQILSGSTFIGHRYHPTLYSLVTDTTVNNLQKSAIVVVFFLKLKNDNAKKRGGGEKNEHCVSNRPSAH